MIHFFVAFFGVLFMLVWTIAWANLLYSSEGLNSGFLAVLCMFMLFLPVAIILALLIGWRMG